MRFSCVFISIICFIWCVPAYSEEPKGSNVIFVNINALRADHLPLYGYKRNTTPNIDKLSRKAVVFENAISQSNWTLPGLAAIFTSRYVHSLGVYTRENKISDKEITLAEILKLYDYNTAAFTGGLDMSGVFGLGQGFDYYFDESKSSPMGRFSDIMPSVLKWLADNRNNKFFLFIDGYDVHPPFNYPEAYQEIFDPGYKGVIDKVSLDYNSLKEMQAGTFIWEGKNYKLNKRDLRHIIAHYDAGVRYADAFLGKLFQEISDLGLMDKTIIIITSEHGEELLDHGSFDRYGKENLYDEVLHVPLIVYCPFIVPKNKKIIRQVQLIDIMPTVLELLGCPVNKEAQGVSFAQDLRGNNSHRQKIQYAYSETSIQKWSVRTLDWKLIYNKGSYELYNLKKDKGEAKNLAVFEPAIVYDLSQRLHEWRNITETKNSPDNTHVELSVEMKDKLREAGYW